MSPVNSRATPASDRCRTGVGRASDGSEHVPEASSRPVSTSSTRHARTTLHAALKPHPPPTSSPTSSPTSFSSSFSSSSLNPKPGSTATARTHPVWFDTRDRSKSSRRCSCSAAMRRASTARASRACVPTYTASPSPAGTTHHHGADPSAGASFSRGAIAPLDGSSVHVATVPSMDVDTTRSGRPVAASGGIVASARTAPACASRSSVTRVGVGVVGDHPPRRRAGAAAVVHLAPTAVPSE
mmetsp:Transcript_13617/g.55137  ORF Transcript_13617/g.55137 Transcript_13617/m.55137 type:complete len:241 (+) Transcript_13617:487-1209(+)